MVGGLTIPGVEAAAVIEDVGEGVAGLAPGRRAVESRATTGSLILVPGERPTPSLFNRTLIIANY